MKRGRPPKHFRDLFAEGVGLEEYRAASDALAKHDIRLSFCETYREWVAQSFGGDAKTIGVFVVTCRMGLGALVDAIRNPQALVDEMEVRREQAAARWTKYEDDKRESLAAEPWTLTVEAPRPAPARFENSEGRQSVLFAGLDCLAGQNDLFATDGQ